LNPINGGALKSLRVYATEYTYETNYLCDGGTIPINAIRVYGPYGPIDVMVGKTSPTPFRLTNKSWAKKNHIVYFDYTIVIGTEINQKSRFRRTNQSKIC